MPGAASRVVLYARAGCHLCGAARAVVARVCDTCGVGFDEVDVDSVPLLVARYGDQVPVVTVDGAVVGFWRIDPDRLSIAIAGGRGSST